MPPPAWTVPPATNVGEAALVMKPLAEVTRVEIAADDDLMALATDEACRLEPVDEQLVAGSAFVDHLSQRGDELGLPLQAEQVVTQMVAEGAPVLARRVEQLFERAGWGAAGEHVEGLAREVRVAADERIETVDDAVLEWPRMKGVEPEDLARLEVLERQDHADVER